jgi:hypothetical protein
MRNPVTILIFLLFSVFAFAEGSTYFEDLLSEMDHERALPTSFSKKYLNRGEHYQGERNFIEEVNLIENYYRMVVRTSTGVGDGEFLYTFTKSGKVIDRKYLGGEYDCDGGAYNIKSTYWKDLEKFTIFNVMIDSCYKTEFVIGFEIKNHMVDSSGKIIVDNKNPCGVVSLPILSEIKLSEEALEGLNQHELKILRNQVFANHGYKFKNDELKKYFSSCLWYAERESFSTTSLNDVEKYNAALIKDSEHRKIVTPNK